MIKKWSNIARETKHRIRQKSFSFLRNLGSNKVNAFWSIKTLNFGDLLTPRLLQAYGFVPSLASPRWADVVAVGSLLQVIPESYTGFIVGSGLMLDTPKKIPYAKILALRGAMTRDRIGASQDIILGDPGLLASELLIVREPKDYVLGIVPHYKDKVASSVQSIFQRYPDDVLIIDVQRNPMDVIIDIDRCSYIMSSSLHGLVTADSLGIPNAWIVLFDKVIGNGFKFYDYASAFGARYEPQYLTGDESLNDLIQMTHVVHEDIPKIKNALDRAFSQLKIELLHPSIRKAA